MFFIYSRRSYLVSPHIYFWFFSSSIYFKKNWLDKFLNLNIVTLDNENPLSKIIGGKRTKKKISVLNKTALDSEEGKRQIITPMSKPKSMLAPDSEIMETLIQKN